MTVSPVMSKQLQYGAKEKTVRMIPGDGIVYRAYKTCFFALFPTLVGILFLKTL